MKLIKLTNFEDLPFYLNPNAISSFGRDEHSDLTSIYTIGQEAIECKETPEELYEMITGLPSGKREGAQTEAKVAVPNIQNHR